MEQFCTFTLESMLFGIEVQKVQEIIRHIEPTPVPLSAPEIEGLINLRGQIVTAIDLRHRLDLPERPGEVLPMCIVLHGVNANVSLVVDTIGEVIEVSEQQFEPTPQTLQGAARRLIRGAFKLDDQLLLILATEKVLDFAGIED